MTLQKKHDIFDFFLLLPACFNPFYPNFPYSLGFIIFKGLDKIHGLRVSKRVEEEGLDIYEHGESAYGV